MNFCVNTFRFWLILVFLFHFELAWSKDAKEKSAKGGVPTVVVTPGAIVYASPNFDAEQITKFSQGKKIYTSNRAYGNEVTFFRVRVGDKIGYISTIDVNRKADVVKSAEKLDQDQRKGKKKSPKLSNPNKPQPPFMFTRYFGLNYGMAAFKEDIAGVNANSQLQMYGVKLTGPDVLFNGPIVDFNFNIHMGPPGYYNSLSQVSPTGLIAWTDALLMSPVLVSKEKAACYIGIGPLLVYSAFRVIQQNQPRDLTAFNLGVSVMAGVGGRFNKVGVRGEVKQFIERKQYTAFQLAVQMEL